MTAPDPLGIAELDAAWRVKEAHDRALTSGGEGRWIACRMSDGAGDGNVYDRREDAVRHQLNETQSLYVCILPVLMPIGDARDLLRIFRQTYDAGFTVTGPAAPPPLTSYGIERQI